MANRKTKAKAAVPAKGRAAIRRQISAALPPKMRDLFNGSPNLTDKDWQVEHGRLLWSLYLHATQQAYATDDFVMSAQWHKIASQHSDEILKLKVLETKQKESELPDKITIGVAGLSRVAPARAPTRKSIEETAREGDE